jgi:hypothetical protein
MDESHLNAPAVHANTADLPTALTSIIGLARMETRVDQGEPGWLGAWLQNRCQQGFDLPEAGHPCGPIYYRLPGIPMALRLSRATLTALFAERARLGWIRAVCGIDQFALDPERWRNLLTPDYRRVGPIYDVMLGEAAFGRLHPGQA